MNMFIYKMQISEKNADATMKTKRLENYCSAITEYEILLKDDSSFTYEFAVVFQIFKPRRIYDFQMNGV